MQTNLNWKKSILSKTSIVYQNNEEMGNLSYSPFSKNSNGKLKEKEYSFISKGFFNEETIILDKSNDKIIGQINYNSWRKEASIVIDGKSSTWKYENLLSTRWSITTSDGPIIKYSGSTTSGKVDSNTLNEILTLSGLFIFKKANFITFRTALAVIIPILIAAIGR